MWVWSIQQLNNKQNKTAWCSYQILFSFYPDWTDAGDPILTDYCHIHYSGHYNIPNHFFNTFFPIFEKRSDSNLWGPTSNQVPCSWQMASHQLILHLYHMSMQSLVPWNNRYQSDGPPQRNQRDFTWASRIYCNHRTQVEIGKETGSSPAADFWCSPAGSTTHSFPFFRSPFSFFILWAIRESQVEWLIASAAFWKEAKADILESDVHFLLVFLFCVQKCTITGWVINWGPNAVVGRGSDFMLDIDSLHLHSDWFSHQNNSEGFGIG